MIDFRHYTTMIFWSLFTCISCKPGSNEKQHPIFKSESYKRLSDSIGHFPNDPELYIKRAALLASQQLQDAAGADLEQAWLISKDPSIAIEWSTNLMNRQQFTKADTVLTQLQRQYPTTVLFARQKALLLQKTHRSKEALSIYQNLILADSNNAVIWFEYGQLLLEKNDTAAAIRSIKKAYTIEDDPYFGIALASIYEAIHDPATIACCNRLIQQYPKQVKQDAQMLKGLYLADAHQYKLALMEFERCIIENYTFLDAHIEKGIVLIAMKQFDKALETFQRAEKVSSSHAEVAYWMGQCYEAKGEMDDAMIAYQRCLALDPGFHEAAERLKQHKIIK